MSWAGASQKRIARVTGDQRQQLGIHMAIWSVFLLFLDVVAGMKSEPYVVPSSVGVQAARGLGFGGGMRSHFVQCAGPPRFHSLLSL